MNITIRMTVDDHKLRYLQSVVPGRYRDIVNKAAVNIQARSIMNTRRVDTGAMKNAWGVNLLGGGGTASGAAASAGALNPAAKIGALPQAGNDYAVVGNMVEYAYWWEVGHRGFAPEPMLTPAVEAERGPFQYAYRYLCDV